MAKRFTFTAEVNLADDPFEYADAVTALKGAVDAFLAALPDGVVAKTEKTITTPKGPTGPRGPRKAKVAAEAPAVEDVI